MCVCVCHVCVCVCKCDLTPNTVADELGRNLLPACIAQLFVTGFCFAKAVTPPTSSPAPLLPSSSLYAHLLLPRPLLPPFAH